MKDLFGDEVPESVSKGVGPNGGKHYVKQWGYAALPGTGPKGERCGTCKHMATAYSGRFRKCELMRPKWTNGQATDILSRSPACSKWEKLGKDRD